MELEVRHLRALCAIAETGSVHKAARQLGMTQPSLTTQLTRIESAVGGRLFTRGRTGSTPTPLGRTVLGRARPLIAEMDALVREARDAAGRGEGGRLRLGSTGSPAIAGWLRRIQSRLPETDLTIQMDVSATVLMRMLTENQLDAVFVHEVEGVPLPVPEDTEVRVLVEREPQFVAMPEGHPATARSVVPLAELGGEQWMVDPSVDGDWPGLRRVFQQAGIEPRVVFGDYLAAYNLVTAGEVLTACQPTARSRPGMAIRALEGDPLAVRLMLVTRPSRGGGPDVDALFSDLEGAYAEAARASDAYRSWIRRRKSPFAPVSVVA